MFLELIAISQVPLIKLDSPVPDPPPVTATKSAGFSSIYFSAQAWPRLTIVSEPLIWIELSFLAADAKVVDNNKNRNNIHFLLMKTSL
jgi:hypothetical protein